MCASGSGRIPIQPLFGWILATFIVAVALFGPPLVGQRIPTLTELRHDVLMIDREFERCCSVRTNTSSGRTDTFVLDNDTRAASARSKTLFREGVS
jgi:hypothetical protein